MKHQGLMQVERRIEENDAMSATVRDAVAVDKTLGAQTGQLTYALTPRAARTSAGGPLGAERFFAATGDIEPPVSAFFHRHGQSPEPNDAAKRLARLYWRKPAHARPAPLWREEEDGRLASGILQVAADAKRKALTEEFRRNAERAELAGEGRQSALERNQALLAQLQAEVGGDAGSVAIARDFTAQQWHAVAYHVQARCACQSRVHSSLCVREYQAASVHDLVNLAASSVGGCVQSRTHVADPLMNAESASLGTSTLRMLPMPAAPSPKPRKRRSPPPSHITARATGAQSPKAPG